MNRTFKDRINAKIIETKDTDINIAMELPFVQLAYNESVHSALKNGKVFM